jgi:threonine synthase
MSGVNSINWARIISQTVYYFYTYFQIRDGRPINFSVPTGNFGDVYAGYLSKKMGLPINKFIVATNKNDILYRAISNGKYEAENVLQTNSPSMDIQIASNFERLIYDLNDCDDKETQKIMQGIKENGQYIISKDKMERIHKDFLSASMSEKEVLDTIKEVYDKYLLILDPHSAIGFGALSKIQIKGNNVVLATAHPCKFPEVINQSIKIKPNLPDELKYVMDEKENYDIISNNPIKIEKYIKSKIQ